jgi:selenide,water dikinase
VDEDVMQILFDPQTSGGLLLGVAAQRAPALRDALRDAGYLQAEIIGEVSARTESTPPVRLL